MDRAETRVTPPSVVRAWLVVHEARAVGPAMILVAVALWFGAQWLLPVPGQARKIPLWQLTPAFLAMLASIATVNPLPPARAGAQLLARGMWAGTVIAAAATCSWVVGSGSDLPSLVPGTTIAVALTFGAATVVGRISVWVGAVVVAVVLARVTVMAADEDLWASLPTTAQVALVAAATLGVAAYARSGAPADMMSRNRRSP